MWQDYAIAIVVASFTLTTVPMILAGTKLPMWTTGPMVVGGVILTVTYATLGLWLSVLVESLSLIGWMILLRRTFKHGA